jgi:UDP-4-amino-4,6-dideoxy-N-acetyl-beta-L-altrosamine transaminase
MSDLLPYGRQTIEDDDVAAVVNALRGDFLTTGPLVDAFERKFCEETGACNAVACNSGTAALHLAVLASGVGPGDAAIVPSVTFLATANAVRFAGAEVVFADVDRDSGLMTVETLQAAMAVAAARNQRVKVALPVHLNGQICDMAALKSMADQHSFELIEDACHALGVSDIGAAPYSRAVCFSTHPVKAITTGEGGVVTTLDRDVADHMRSLRNHAMMKSPDAFTRRDLAFDGTSANPWYYEMVELGWNYRLPDILCALGISQLGKLERFWRRRVEIAALYDRLLAPFAPILRPAAHGEAPHGWHLYPVLIDFAALGTTRQSFTKALREQGIGTQVHYIPVHEQPYYRERYGACSLAGADAYYARCLSIPIFPAMADSDVHRVAEALAKLVQRAAA